MAESKRAETEEKYDLPVPPFDAPAYVAKEKIAARATVVLAIYGLLLGQLAAIFMLTFQNAVSSLGVFLFGLVALKAVLELTHIDYAGWDRKGWAGHILLLFFTFLAAWVVFSNPPFVV